MNPSDYNDETYINNLVDSFKSTGDESKKDELIVAFDPYFKKYAYLLCSNRPVDLSNKDTIKFLRLFMNDDDRKSDESIIKAARRIIPHIRNVYKHFEFQDVYNDMICYFLEQLYRYKVMIANHKHDKPRISFTHFIQVNLRFKLGAATRPRERDALSCFYNVEFNDKLDQSYMAPNAGINQNAIDLSWVHGFTTGELFKNLTTMERYLLYLKYEDLDDKPLSEYEISRLTGMDRMYIRRKMLKLKKKIETLVKENS